MWIDTHTHICSFPSFSDLSDKIRTREDLVAFRTRYPDLYQKRLTESPIDNSDDLIEVMDRHGVDITLVQATPGYVPNEKVAEAVAKHPKRLRGLMRIGHDQEAAGYLEDPTPVREMAGEEVAKAVEKLGMIGVGEIFIRALTREIHPERIAEDLSPLMDAVARYEIPIQFPTAWSQFPGNLYYGNPVWVDEVAARWPEVPIILTKMGRSIGFYFDMTMTVAMRNENVYLDTVGTSAEHLRLAVKALGAHRILFGTDWSTTWRWVREPEDVHTRHKNLLRDAGLNASEREQILWKNAARIFRLDV